MDIQLKGLRAFSAVALLIAFFSEGCSFVLVGHKIELDRIEQISPGTTTESELLDLFGKPDAVNLNKVEGITTYVFKNLRHTGLILPIPFLALGKSADKGYVLNVLVKEGVVINYELIRLQGSYYPFY